jgi:hypothetical protein
MSRCTVGWDPIYLCKFQLEALRMIVDTHQYVPKGSPNTNSYRRNLPLQLSIQCSPQHTPKRPSSEPLGTSRKQQATVKAPAKWSPYQIPSVTVVFVVPVCKSHSQKPQEALNLLVTEESYWALFCMPLYTFIHNLLNVMGLKKTL